MSFDGFAREVGGGGENPANNSSQYSNVTVWLGLDNDFELF